MASLISRSFGPAASLAEEEPRPKRKQPSIRKRTTNRRMEHDARTIHGKIHGRIIELDEDPGAAEGQEVEVQLKVIEPPKPHARERGACQGVRDPWAAAQRRGTPTLPNAITSINHEGYLPRYSRHDRCLG